ncbi:MAG: carboxypeptidase-like regulatory domain-containing protein [Chloroflexota bacterium]
MKTINTPTFTRLLDWLENRLPESEAKVVAADVQMGSEALQTDVAWLRSFLLVSRQLKLARPPARVRQELRHRFAAQEEEARRPTFFQRVLASLIFDSRTQLVTAGLRAGASQAAATQFVYTSGVADVALDVQPRRTDPQLDLSGQVFPLAGAVVSQFFVTLLQDTAEVRATSTDDLGEFSFAALPAGEYSLVVSSDQFEVFIPSLPVAAQDLLQ